MCVPIWLSSSENGTYSKIISLDDLTAPLGTLVFLLLLVRCRLL